ncbi:MAG: Fic family protein [bacterium]|nr:Fic family protein [bacterium]
MYDQLEQLKVKLEAHRPLSETDQAKVDEVLVPRRVYFTNIFEDSTLTLEETKFYIQTNRMTGGKLEREFHQIRGVMEAITRLRQLLKSGGDLDEKSIKEVHALLTSPIEQADRYHPGEFRTQDGFIMAKDGARVNFVSHECIPEEMKSLLDWYHSQWGKIHPVEIAARVHYWFILIHPFSDANGRLARLLDDFILVKGGYEPAIIEDRVRYFAAIRQQDQNMPTKNRLAEITSVNLHDLVSILEEASCQTMNLMLDVLEQRYQAPALDLSERLQMFDRIISGSAATEDDRRLAEERETTKLALSREISETLKQKVQSRIVKFLLSGPAKFQQNDYTYSPLISEVANRHQFSFSPNEGLYEYHLVPDLEAVNQAGLSLKPFMKLLSFAIISNNHMVGVFSAILPFEFGRVYIKQENRGEIIMRLDAESIRELVGGASYQEWDLKTLQSFIYNSLDYFFHLIEVEYLETQKAVIDPKQKA